MTKENSAVDTDWKTTKQLAQNLAVSKHRVLKWIKTGFLKPGIHYRDISPDGKRPTYRFNLKQINQLFE